MGEWAEATRLRGLFPLTLMPPHPPAVASPSYDQRTVEPDNNQFAVALVLTLLIPLVGLILGLMDLGSGRRYKQSQGCALILFAALMFAIYFAAFAK